jgi:hypothetical protein
MSPAKNEAQTVGAVLGFSGLTSNEQAHSHSPEGTCQEPVIGAFLGPANERQARVLAELMGGRRLTNNDVRSIAGALNGPHIIQGLREQGLSPTADLCTEWIKCRDRDGHAVRYGVYFLTPTGHAKARPWSRSQRFTA